MNRLFEAIDKYNKDKDEIALYKNVINSDINYNEMVIVLEDTLGNKFDDYKLACLVTDSLLENTKENGYKPATDKDFD